ncbi:DUF3859 domain-containing protein [Nodosilinea sp. LEGE 07298]|uniref:DUF3859 domain-containing protein n=1 Tax=Nodosilinea sp. LEGE 07298 TaxID=2777970 RepID=UPI0018825755|nr:DUF3859 domain-containing protein [Nodosilinea sp. LEGE 07298]MBE9111330.1 DUF3859 domain-containing protein [Nodosilinea sp. LEGE 07298]
MDKRLTDTQVQRLVAEVQRLSDRHQAELDAAEVQDILQQLDLSPEFLDDALVQLKRQDALVVQQRRRRWLVAGVAGVVALGLASWLWLGSRQQQQLAQVVAQGDRITLSQDDGGNLSRVVPQVGGSELVYRITLADAPVGDQLALSCSWTDPDGQVVHQNQYRTKTITTAVWPTYCRYTVGPESPKGNWTVQAFVGDRQLSDATFSVD